MLTRTFTFIDDDENLRHYPYWYFKAHHKFDGIVIDFKYRISRCGIPSSPKSLHGPYFTATIGDNNYISQDLIKLCEFVKEKIKEE